MSTPKVLFLKPQVFDAIKALKVSPQPVSISPSHWGAIVDAVAHYVTIFEKKFSTLDLDFGRLLHRRLPKTWVLNEARRVSNAQLFLRRVVKRAVRVIWDASKDFHPRVTKVAAEIKDIVAKRSPRGRFDAVTLEAVGNEIATLGPIKRRIQVGQVLLSRHTPEERVLTRNHLDQRAVKAYIAAINAYPSLLKPSQPDRSTTIVRGCVEIARTRFDDPPSTSTLSSLWRCFGVDICSTLTHPFSWSTMYMALIRFGVWTKHVSALPAQTRQLIGLLDHMSCFLTPTRDTRKSATNDRFAAYFGALLATNQISGACQGLFQRVITRSGTRVVKNSLKDPDNLAAMLISNYTPFNRVIKQLETEWATTCTSSLSTLLKKVKAMPQVVAATRNIVDGESKDVVAFRWAYQIASKSADEVQKMVEDDYPGAKPPFGSFYCEPDVFQPVNVCKGLDLLLDVFMHDHTVNSAFWDWFCSQFMNT